MSTVAIRKKLHHYIETAQDKKVKAIFTMVEDEIGETYDRWNDEAFLAELLRREESYLNGTSKTYTPEQVFAKARKGAKKIKHS